MTGNDSLYDCIVVGLGGVGSAAAYHLARAGQRVLGIDRFNPPHDFGSSHGDTRVIRKAYFEDPSYVPLMCRAYELWESLQKEFGQQLYFPAGVLQVGPEDGAVVSGVRQSANQYHLPIENLSSSELAQRFPMLRGDESWSAVLERDAGFLAVEQCVEAHLHGALASGATLIKEQTVTDWQADDEGVTVMTDDATFRAKRLVLAAGPWAEEWLWKYAVPIQVVRKYSYWYEPEDDSYNANTGFPCFYFETPEGDFYGCPQRDGRGLKVARHTGGITLGTVAAGDHVADPATQEAIESFLFKHLPGVTMNQKHWSGCYYTMTPDKHFIVDVLPTHRNVTVIAGLSGHGFKFTSVLGEIAAKLAMDHETGFDLSCFRIDRFIA